MDIGGVGKTSALIQLKKMLGDEVIPVWFEAWRFQNEEMPIVALLHRIKEEFTLKAKLMESAQKIGSVTILGVLSAFDEAIKVASGGLFAPKFSEIPKIATDFEKEHFLSPLQSFKLNELLQDAINAALGNQRGKKLVIFIDDLDRCSPETALKLLEGIKLYLNLNNCVTVFAIDQRQIEAALNRALDHKGDVHHAREYLEKICQDIFHLPLPSAEKKSNYLNSLLTPLLETGITGSKQEIAKHLDSIQKVLNKFDCLPANPRKIKALANRLSVMLRCKLSFSDTLIETDIKRDYCLLISVAIIYTFHREVNEQLQKNANLISKVMSYAQDPRVADDTIIALMSGIQPSQNASEDLPVNPSDSNVFRLHKLFIALGAITEKEITPLLGL